MAPLAAGAHEVEQAVQHPPHVGRARPAVRPAWRADHRGQQGVPLVAEGLPGTDIADQRPALRCPHGVPPEGLLPSRTADATAPPHARLDGASFSNGL